MEYNYHKVRKERIQSVVSIIKLFLLFVLLITIFHNYFSAEKMLAMTNLSIIRIVLFLVIFTSIFFWWKYIPGGVRRISAFAAIGEYAFFFAITATAIVITENYEYHINYVFLMLLAAATMEYGMNRALFLAGACAAFNIIYSLMRRGAIAMESQLPVALSYAIITYTIGYYVKGEQAHIDMLTEQISRDSLTRLHNFSGFHTTLDTWEAEGDRLHTISLIVADLDDFKIYNNVAGHESGDEALKTVAEHLIAYESENIKAYRYQEDEFALLFRNTSLDIVEKTAQNLAEDIRSIGFPNEDQLPSHILSASVGVSAWPSEVSSLTDLVTSAYEAVKKAKFTRQADVAFYTDIAREIAKEFSSDAYESWISMCTLITVINYRDNYTAKHTERVASYCNEFALAHDLSAEDRRTLVSAAYLHDVGKLDLEKDLLLKTGPLTDTEYARMQTHSAKGAKMLEDLPALASLAGIVRHHHERYDGKGYPDNLAGEEIEYLARILAVADSFDAMTSPRPYQPKKSFRQGLDELKNNRGTQFDPDIVDLFVAMSIKQEYA